MVPELGRYLLSAIDFLIRSRAADKGRDYRQPEYVPTLKGRSALPYAPTLRCPEFAVHSAQRREYLSAALSNPQSYGVLRSSTFDLSESEDILETTHSIAESDDHGRRPKLPSEPQTCIATNEIVVATGLVA